MPPVRLKSSRRLLSGFLLLGLGLFGTACSGDEGAEPATPEQARIEERSGTYEGAGLGDNASAVFRALGRQAQTGESVLPENHGADVRTFPFIRVPGKSPRPPREGFLAFDGVYFLLAEGRVVGVVVLHPGSATSRGVAIGDPLSDAEAAYPEVACDIAHKGDEYPNYPYCAGRVANRRHIWFGGDPIDTIEMNVFRFPNAPVPE